ncbi:MAG: hypothetical protein WKF31_11715 [Thermoleophilaceae bacterium]
MPEILTEPHSLASPRTDAPTAADAPSPARTVARGTTVARIASVAMAVPEIVVTNEEVAGAPGRRARMDRQAHRHTRAPGGGA